MPIRKMEAPPLSTPITVGDGEVVMSNNRPWSRWFSAVKSLVDGFISPFQESAVMTWPGLPVIAATFADTDLSLNLEGERTYLLDIDLLVEADAVGGFKFDLGGTAVYSYGVLQINVIANDPAGMGAGTLALNTWRKGGVGFAQFSLSGATKYHVSMRGLITITKAGTLTIQFAQAAASGTTYLCTGSRIMAWERQ